MVLDPGSNKGVEKRRKIDAERQVRYLQPDLLPDHRLRERGNGGREQGQGDTHDAGNAESRYGNVAIFNGSGTEATGQNRVQGNVGQGTGYGGEGSIGFGVGVGNISGSNDEFLLDAGLENLDWLDTVDWTRGPWIDLNY